MMKNSNYKMLTLFGLMFLLLTACGKYEEGPDFSLRTKKARLVGKWIPVKYTNQDGSQDAGENEATHEFTKENTYVITGSLGSSTGTWDFINDKAGIRTSYSIPIVGSVINDWEILRLTNKELWVKNAQGVQINLEPVN